MSQPASETIHFFKFHISSDVDLLYRGKDVVPLQPRAVRVLRYLAEHHHRVVSKRELLEKIWPDVFTTDDVLKKAVLQARRALGDSQRGARFIETHHRCGYRFVAPVKHFPPGGPEPNGPAYCDQSAGKLAEGADQTPAHRLSSAESPQGPELQENNGLHAEFDQLVGRDAELNALKAEYRRVLEGSGRSVIITGEAGIGKTQLARHFVRWARQQGALCLYGRFFDYPGSHLAPYEVFLDLLRAALRVVAVDEPGKNDSSADLRALAQRVCGISLPEELFTDRRGPSEQLERRLYADSESYRVVFPIGKCFMNLSRIRPMVIVLDDLQWMDEGSRDLVSYLMRTATTEPLFTVGLARNDESTNPDHALAEWLRLQASYRSYTGLTLKPFDEAACRSAIKAVFVGFNLYDIPAGDLRTLYHITGGNPYFLMEMLRLLVSEGAISNSSWSARRWQWRGVKDLHLPDTLVMLAHARLDRLPQSVRALIEQAAIIGDEFRMETLSLMAGATDQEIEPLLRTGVHCGVLCERGLSPGEDYRFHHTILRRVVYDTLSPRRRRALHARAAQAVEAIYAGELDRVAAALSVHCEEARDFGRAYEWSMRAWQAACARLNMSEAVENIERAYRTAQELDRRAENQLPPHNRLKLLIGLSKSYYSVGRLKESESVLRDSLELALSLDDRCAAASVLLQRGLTRIGLSSYHDAIGPTEQALEIYRQAGDSEAIASCLVQLGRIQVAMGRYESAAQLAGQAVQSVNAQSQIGGLAICILGWARVLQARYQEGISLLEQALDHHDRSGDLRCRALLLARLHWANLSRGQYESSIILACRARDDFHLIGDVRWEARMDMGIGQARVAQGLYEEGIELLGRALETARNIGAVHIEAESLWLLGRAHCESGRYTEAAALLERSLGMVRRIGDRDDEFRVLTDIARLKISCKDYPSALQAAGEAADIAQDLNNRDGLGAALVERAQALAKLNKRQAALELAQKAVELLQESGSGERWRGYWTLATSLTQTNDGDAPVDLARGLVALRQCVELLEKMRAQIDSSDGERRALITRARSGPAYELREILLRMNLVSEAKAASKEWLLDE